MTSEKNQLVRVKYSVEKCRQELKQKEMELDSVNRNLAMKQSELAALQESIREQNEELKSKELKLKSIEKSISQDEQICPLILIDDNMVDQDLTPREVLSALKSTADSAKFILDLMPGGFLQYSGNANSKSKVLLMEKLIEVRPISAIAKTEARKLAVLWNENLTSETEKSTEVWAFLLFVAAYRLVGCFQRDEIIKLVVDSADQKHSPDICRFFGFTDRIPEIIGALMERKRHIDAARFSCAFNLLQEFKLEEILVNWVEHIKGKAVNEELNALKAIQQLIAEYKLGFMYDARNLGPRIRELEMIKQSSKQS